MPNRVEKCPLCNFEVALSSNHPHQYLCANLHRPFTQWLGTDSGYPVYAHPDETEPLPESPIDEESFPIAGTTLLNELLTEDIPDTSTPEMPEFGGGGDFVGGGGGDSF